MNRFARAVVDPWALLLATAIASIVFSFEVAFAVDVRPPLVIGAAISVLLVRVIAELIVALLERHAAREPAFLETKPIPPSASRGPKLSRQREDE